MKSPSDLPVNSSRPNDYAAYPDAHGRYGDYGGQYVPETLMPALAALERGWEAAREDPRFRDALALVR